MIWLLALAAIVGSLWVAPAEAQTTRWASNDGTGVAPCTTNASSVAMCPVAIAIDTANPGDTVNLLGSGTMPTTYNPNIFTRTGTNGIIDPTSSTKSNVTVRCMTIAGVFDAGGCLGDGEFTKSTLKLDVGNNGWIVEGIDGRNGSASIFEVRGNNNVVRNAVAWDRKFDSGNGTATFACTSTGVGNVFEDVAAFGVGLWHFSHSQNKAGSCTFRRAWGRFEGGSNSSNHGGPFGGMFYNAYLTTCDNCIGEYAPNIGTIDYNVTAVQESTCPPVGGLQRCTDGAPARPVGPFGLNRWDGNTDSGAGDNNQDGQVSGSLFFVQSGANLSRLQGSPVSLLSMSSGNRGGGFGFVDTIFWISPAHPQFNTLHAVDLPKRTATVPPIDPHPEMFLTDVTTMSGLGNDVETTGSAAEGLWVLTDTFAVSTLAAFAPGQARNPFTATAGANLCYRYENRVRQDGTGGTSAQPLWPWPMNTRILKATAFVTYPYGTGYTFTQIGCGATPGAACTGAFPSRAGQSVDLTALVESMFNQEIPGACRTDGGSSFAACPTCPVEAGELSTFTNMNGFTTVVGSGFAASGGAAVPQSAGAATRFDQLYEEDQEGWYFIGTVPTAGDTDILFVRWTDVNNRIRLGVTVVSGAGNDTFALTERVAGAVSTLIPDTSLSGDIATGDRVGMRCVDTSCSAYWCRAAEAGACRTIGTATVTYRPASSYIVLGGTSGSIASFGGGGVEVGADSTPPDPDPPTGLTLAVQSDSAISVTSDSCTDAVSGVFYLSYRCDDTAVNGCTPSALVNTSTEPTFLDTGLTANNSYAYRRKCSDGTNVSTTFSSRVEASTLAAPDTTDPSAPGALTVALGPRFIDDHGTGPSAVIRVATAATDAVTASPEHVVSAGAQSNCSDCVEICRFTPPTLSVTASGGIGATCPIALQYSTTRYFQVHACDAAGNCGDPTSTVGITFPSSYHTPAAAKPAAPGRPASVQEPPSAEEPPVP